MALPSTGPPSSTFHWCDIISFLVRCWAMFMPNPSRAVQTMGEPTNLSDLNPLAMNTDAHRGHPGSGKHCSLWAVCPILKKKILFPHPGLGLGCWPPCSIWGKQHTGWHQNKNKTLVVSNHLAGSPTFWRKEKNQVLWHWQVHSNGHAFEGETNRSLHLLTVDRPGKRMCASWRKVVFGTQKKKRKN